MTLRREVEEDEEDTDGDAAVGNVEDGEGPELEEIRDHPIVDAIEEVGKGTPEDETVADDLAPSAGPHASPRDQTDGNDRQREEEGGREVDTEGDASVLAQDETDPVPQEDDAIVQGPLNDESCNGADHEAAENRGGQEGHRARV